MAGNIRLRGQRGEGDGADDIGAVEVIFQRIRATLVRLLSKRLGVHLERPEVHGKCLVDGILPAGHRYGYRIGLPGVVQEYHRLFGNHRQAVRRVGTIEQPIIRSEDGIETIVTGDQDLAAQGPGALAPDTGIAAVPIPARAGLDRIADCRR